MIERRPFADLGKAEHGWLHAVHHFSFANYYDPERMGWGKLLVWNDDTIEPNTGFGTHPHKEMEIITYIRNGAITHGDSMGHLEKTYAGDVQVMSAGSGVWHSEHNREDEAMQLFQIWIQPTMPSGSEVPSYGNKPFPAADRHGQFVVLASGMGDEDALPIRTNARVLGAFLKAGESLDYTFKDQDRYGYLVPALGQVTVNDVAIHERDGAAIHGEKTIRIVAQTDAEIVMVDTE
ncbi:MAG: pirin family protein [Veillonella sp.]|nr:pirin family protein [Veillonella sp.]